MLNVCVHLTHNDLDALGCMLHLEAATLNTEKITFHTNYRDLAERVSDVIEYCEKHRPKMLFISDISFSNNKGQLQKLEELLEHGIKVILVDHHEYPEGFFDDIKIIVKHDIGKSATGICEKFFGTANHNLLKLSEYINAYDIWLETRPDFNVSVALNDYFWNYIDTRSISNLMYDIVQNDYKLPQDFVQYFKDYQIETVRKIESYRKRKLIMSDGFFCVAFVDDTFNEILIDEFSKSTQFVFIANSYGVTRFRFKGNSTLSRAQKEEIKMKLIGTLNNGHLNAFSVKIHNSNFDKIMDRVQEVQGILAQYKPK